ncbi:MAG: protein kinase [Myxococcota bacterium]
MNPKVGDLIGGKYKLVHEIGRGGMGVVFSATNQVLGRKVAVKILKPEFATQPVVLNRFVNEARSAAVIDHPNVVDVLDVDQDGDLAFMVLELLRGEPLSARIERTPMKWDECWKTVEPILHALQAAHRVGIVHRDLKPENIFLSTDGAGRTVPKILDFGIAKLAQSTRSDQLTRTGLAIGTPYYMAPEQAMGSKGIGPWTDVWAMATVIFECLTGDFPIKFDTDGVWPTIQLQITTDRPRGVEELVDAPAHVSAALKAALVQDPRARLRSINQLRRLLAGEDAGEDELADRADTWGDQAHNVHATTIDLPQKPEPKAAPEPAPARRNNQWLAIGVLGVLAVGVAAAVGFAFRGSPQPPTNVPVAPTEPPVPVAPFQPSDPAPEAEAPVAEEPTPPPLPAGEEAPVPPAEAVVPLPTPMTAMTSMTTAPAAMRSTTMASSNAMRTMQPRTRSMAVISEDDY